jgi:oxygen-independent coproporphyrinogen-3 oxidase
VSGDKSKSGCKGVGLYVHIPFCHAKCYYCGFYSEPIENQDSDRLISAVISEMNRYDLAENVQTIYVGGGSPSCLPKEQLLRLVGELSSRCQQADEFTVEVNPGQVEEGIPVKLCELGVNRFSIGAQSFVQSELDFLGRGHLVNSITQAVSTARKSGYENISLDLIFAVPGSNPDSWRFNLQSVIDLEVEHISAYSLSYEDGTKLKKDMADGKVVPVEEDTDRDMYELAIDMLNNVGFIQYEISNFAKAGFQCRHNLGYWANDDYVGVGPNASSYLDGQRTSNIADINQYIHLIEQGMEVKTEAEKLNAVEFACETAVLNLRRLCGVYFDEFEVKTGFDFQELFSEVIDKYEKPGLIELTKERVCLSRKAFAIADSVLCDFAAV